MKTNNKKDVFTISARSRVGVDTGRSTGHVHSSVYALQLLAGTAFSSRCHRQRRRLPFPRHRSCVHQWLLQLRHHDVFDQVSEWHLVKTVKSSFLYRKLVLPCVAVNWRRSVLHLVSNWIDSRFCPYHFLVQIWFVSTWFKRVITMDRLSMYSCLALQIHSSVLKYDEWK